MRENNELGLKVNYETDHDLALALEMLLSLAFIEKIGNYYDMIVQRIQNLCERISLVLDKMYFCSVVSLLRL